MSIENQEVQEEQQVQPDAAQENQQEQENTGSPEQSATPEEDIVVSDPVGVKKRISKLAKKAADAQAEVEYWKQQALSRQQEQGVTPVHQVDDGKPKLGDFQDFESYTEALTDWKLKNVAESHARQEQEQKRIGAYNKQVEEFSKSAPDFALAVGEIQDQILSDKGMTELILESDVGAAMAYHLATHEEEFNRIMGLTPVRRIAALSKLEASLQLKQSTNKTTAPKPVSKVTGNGSSTVAGGSVGKPSADASFAEWKKWRNSNKK